MKDKYTVGEQLQLRPSITASLFQRQITNFWGEFSTSVILDFRDLSILSLGGTAPLFLAALIF